MQPVINWTVIKDSTTLFSAGKASSHPLGLTDNPSKYYGTEPIYKGYLTEYSHLQFHSENSFSGRWKESWQSPSGSTAYSSSASQCAQNYSISLLLCCIISYIVTYAHNYRI